MATTSDNNTVPENIPEQITIGETAYSIKATPELMALVKTVTQQVQKTEKNKLYDTIETLKTQVATLQKEKEAIQTSSAALPVPTPKPLENPPSTTEIRNQLKASDSPITMDEVNNLLHKKFTEDLPAILQNLLKPVTDELNATKAEQVRLYRNRRLLELGDAVVPELVVGNTPDEVEQSIASSALIRQRYAAVSTPVTPVTPVIPVSQFTPPPAAPIIPRIPFQDEQQLSVKNLSDKEFAAQRDNLYSKIKAEAGQYPSISSQ